MASNEKKTTEQGTEDYLVLPVRDLVVYPHMIAPLYVGREKSINAITDAWEDDRKLLVVAQKDATKDDPGPDDYYETGTICAIHQVLKLPDGTLKVLVEGQERAKVNKFEDDGVVLRAKTSPVAEGSKTPAKELDALVKVARESFEAYAKAHPTITDDTLAAIKTAMDQTDNPGMFADMIASHLVPKESGGKGSQRFIEQKQEILEQTDIAKRLEKITQITSDELEIMETDKKIKSNVKQQMEKTQREYYLNEQMKAIQKELNGGEDAEDTIIEEYAALISEKLPTLEKEEGEELTHQEKVMQEARKQALKELKKLKILSPQSSEATVLRNYLDAILDLPWYSPSKINNNIENARKILDEDHYGLDKVKDKVIKQLAIQKRLADKGLEGAAKAKIICLVGPPGVGKTSICKSLARATGREYLRMALGGVTDEAKIRGHRRTYIGSKPGEIIEKITKAGTSNPLFVLDELDKLNKDFKGDPTSALLEVLDPEQNHAFNDHYLEIDYDLSDVMFVGTANVWANIPAPLQDRMDTIFLGSYTEDEKLEIAKQHLVRKQMRSTGLDDNEFNITEDALRALIRYYTKESGVRRLQREIGNICAEAVMALEGKAEKVEVTTENLEQYAGKHKVEYDETREHDMVGVVTGLAFTEIGGETLSIESTLLTHEKQDIILTGQLGDVMKESTRVALSVAKKKAADLGYEKSLETLSKSTIHLHVPEGATPKDGPSAGGAMLTALFSSVTGRPIRKDIAMTGELNLSGQITAIGGLREKLSAASRAGYTTVLIPQQNAKDLDEVPQQVKDALEIIPVSTADEVLSYALVGGNDLHAPAEEKLDNEVIPPKPTAGGVPTQDRLGPQ